MKSHSSWISLNELSRIYGISETMCGIALENQGWCDQVGNPTNGALTAGAACLKNFPRSLSKKALWNPMVCKEALQKEQESLKIERWAQLLETLEQGCPAIITTTEQMAKEVPDELIDKVNIKLTNNGCDFQVRKQ